MTIPETRKIERSESYDKCYCIDLASVYGDHLMILQSVDIIYRDF